MADRSPNFPSISLGEALDLIKLVYQREGRSKMPRLSAIRPLGYTSINGRSLSILGALRAYGLLEGRGDDVRVSDDAITILNAPADSIDRREALVRSFESPAAFALLRSKGDASPDTLRWHLIKANFRDESADKLIRVYLESKDCLNAEVGRYDSRETPEDRQEEVAIASEPTAPSIAPARQIRPDVRVPEPVRSSDRGYIEPDFKISLGGGRWLLIEVRGGEPTERDFIKLEKFARFQRELLEDDPDSSPSFSDPDTDGVDIS